MPAWLRAVDDRVLVEIRLTPKAARDAIGGTVTGGDGKDFLAARVRAVPEKGKANKALETLLARALGVPKSTVSVVGGATSRMKTVAIACRPDERPALERRLTELG